VIRLATLDGEVMSRHRIAVVEVLVALMADFYYSIFYVV